MTAVADTPLRVGLRGRVLKAGTWIVGGQLIGQLIRLCSNVILTHLLFPDAFGLMSVVNVLITALGLFSDIGIVRSIVQSPRGEEPGMLNTAWTIQVIRGQFLALGCVVAACAFALTAHVGLAKAGTVYADSRLPWIVGVFAIVPVISAFDSIRNAVARRHMHLHVLIKMDVTTQFTTAVVMVLVAWLTRSIWTLIVGAVTTALVRCVMGHVVLPGHREKLQIDKSALKELMSQGKWIFLSSILTFLATNGDRIFLGGIIDAREFGLYVIALLIVAVPQTLASMLCNSIVYPALSEVFRERPHELGRVLQRFEWGYDAIVTLLFAALVSAGPALVDVLYDSRYHEAGWMMSILSVGMIGMRFQVVEQCYQAVGKPQYMTLANLLRLATMVAGVFIGRHVAGMQGIVVGIAMSQYAAWPLALWFKGRYHALTLRAELLLVPAIVVGLGVGWLVSLAAHHLFAHRFA